MSPRFGFGRTKPGVTNDRKPGWRLFLPVWVATRLGYDINTDRFVTGRWLYTVAVAAEPLGGPRNMHGLSLRVTWGWLLRAKAVRS